MNQTQTQTTLAPIVAFLAGLLAGKGVFGFDATTWAMILGSAFGLAATIWGAIAARQSAIVSQTATIAQDPNSPVKGVITTNTPEGRAMAQSIPASTIVAAGTTEAQSLAKGA